MDLKTYLSDHNLSLIEFSRLVKSTPNAVGHWVSRKRMPRGVFIERIKEVTDGKVTANDFFHSGVSQ